jgi:enoyl-CoA hydratase/carnithine racemase
MAEKKLINYSAKDGIAVLELNDPPANAYTHEMMKQLDEAILAARMDETIQVIVVRGSGEKFFCAGANIKMLAGSSPEYRYHFSLHANETLSRLEQTPKLVIGALNGHTVGGGLEIALACDIRIAKKDGGNVGLPEITLGVLPGTGGTQRLPRLIGKSRALELAVTGRTISFDEALEMGIVNYVYESDRFFENVLEYAKQFTLPNKASMAVGKIKRAIVSGLETALTEGLALEREALSLLFRSGDATEGLNAYLEKRRAVYKGE